MPTTRRATDDECEDDTDRVREAHGEQGYIMRGKTVLSTVRGDGEMERWRGRTAKLFADETSKDPGCCRSDT